MQVKVHTWSLQKLSNQQQHRIRRYHFSIAAISTLILSRRSCQILLIYIVGKCSNFTAELKQNRHILGGFHCYVGSIKNSLSQACNWNVVLAMFIQKETLISVPKLYKARQTHLAKWPSDVKQNGTHEKTPFSGTVFKTFSHVVLCFVASGSFKNHWIEASYWLSKNFNQSEGGFISYHS